MCFFILKKLKNPIDTRSKLKITKNLPIQVNNADSKNLMNVTPATNKVADVRI